MKTQEIPTPALLVDLDAMEFNLRLMADFFADKPAKLRPHFKNHKAPMLAWKQMRTGAIGLTCATIREAEILVQHGIQSILIANEITGDWKTDRYAELSRHASLLVGVDHPAQICDLARAQRKYGTTLQVLIDVDSGLGRCGVKPGEQGVELATLAKQEGLKVRGITGYEGHLQPLPPGPERDERVHAVCQDLVQTKTMLEAAGIPADIVSTGGTGTYAVCGSYPGITEIQAGSYLLMDTQYRDRGAPFRRALTILASVISTRGSNHAVIDCGLKELSAERGLSELKDLPGVTLKALHAEHGLLQLDTNSGPPLEVGQKIELWVQYSDATVNLHTSLYGVRNGQTEEVFPIIH
jgi:D-serine deaminase-like pyridoxal phosphate-dependent protein